MSKHTPGPWHYKIDGFRITIGNASTRHDYLEHDRTVAVIEDNSLHAQADARLITAAPDLLEACKLAQGALRYAQKDKDASLFRVALSSISSAIRKAEPQDDGGPTFEPPDVIALARTVLRKAGSQGNGPDPRD